MSITEGLPPEPSASLPLAPLVDAAAGWFLLDEPSRTPAGSAAGDAGWLPRGVEVPSPVLEGLEDLHRIVGELDDLAIGGLSAVRTREALVRAQRLVSRVSAVVAALVAHGTSVDVGSVNGSPSTAVWFAHATKATRAEAHRVARIGEATERYAVLGAAHRTGAVGVEQADVIVRALDELPADLDPEVRRAAESVLVDYARDFDAKDLRGLGKKILSVVAPEIGDAHEAALLERQERDAVASARLTMTADGTGVVRGRFTLPELHGAILHKALDAYAAPAHQNATPAASPAADSAVDSAIDSVSETADPGAAGTVGGGGDAGGSGFRVGVAGPQRLGEAFVEFLESLVERDLPDVAGTGATIVVTMTLDALTGGLASAAIDTGDTLSASTVRRLACEARIIPAVLGGAGEVLDLGRARRFHTTAQRRAIAVRDRGCTAEGCDRPPHQCHVHHETPWSQGGHTDTHSGRLLCGHHHRRAHDPRYATERLGTGKLRFTRRN